MFNPKTLADAYLALWNEADPARRRAMLDVDWAADAHYADPMMKGEGRDDIALMIEGARAQFPGHSFTLRGTPDGHSRFIRFSWSLAPDGGAPIIGGTDVARIDDHGQLTEVIGFLDGEEHG